MNDSGGSAYSAQSRRLFILALLVPCLLVTVPAFLALRIESQLAGSVRAVSHTIEVQRELQEVLTSLVDAESGQRGFLLTTRDRYLQPYRAAVGRLPQQIAGVRTLFTDNSVQRKHLQELEALIATRLDIMARTLSLAQGGDQAAALALVNTDQGQQAMEAVRHRVDAMQREESRLLARRNELLRGRTRLSSYVLLGLIGLNVLFAAGMLVLFRRLSKVQGLVTVCAWSRTVEYEGEWLSFEQYLRRRFHLDTSHGLSPAEAERAFGPARNKPG